MEIKSIFQSSLDPSKVSLTVQGLAKFVTFIIITYATAKGFDPNEATNGVDQIKDIIISTIPACFALYHAGETVYGIVRKMFVQR